MLLFGYVLGPERLAQLRRRTEVDLNLLPLNHFYGAYTDLAKRVMASPNQRLSDLNTDTR
ncbi:MAG: hypothetical protein ACJASY_001229 [Halioglobus sp.]|jgi:hypothetical protein